MREDIDWLKERVEDLDYRVAQYARELRWALEENDRLALDAAWGVVNGFNNFCALALAVVAANWIEPRAGWIWATVGCVAVYIICMIWGARAYFKGWERDKAKLREAPEYEPADW